MNTLKTPQQDTFHNRLVCFGGLCFEQFIKPIILMYEGFFQQQFVTFKTLSTCFDSSLIQNTIDRKSLKTDEVNNLQLICILRYDNTSIYLSSQLLIEIQLSSFLSLPSSRVRNVLTNYSDLSGLYFDGEVNHLHVSILHILKQAIRISMAVIIKRFEEKLGGLIDYNNWKASTRYAKKLLSAFKIPHKTYDSFVYALTAECECMWLCTLFQAASSERLRGCVSVPGREKRQEFVWVWTTGWFFALKVFIRLGMLVLSACFQQR